MTVGSANRVALVKQRVEALTDDLAAKPYESLEPDELDELMATLEPLAALLLAAQDTVDAAATVLFATLSRGLSPTR